MPIKNHFLRFYSGLITLFTKLIPLTDFAIRIWLFKAFFFSGWLKTKNWGSTVYLFENEYQVPLLPAQIAAYLGTAAEIMLPVLLLVGLASRVSAFFLFIFNIAIVCCYPFLWTPDGMHGLQQHITWGLMILVIVVHGPGQLSMDYLIKKKWPGYEY